MKIHQDGSPIIPPKSEILEWRPYSSDEFFAWSIAKQTRVANIGVRLEAPVSKDQHWTKTCLPLGETLNWR